jgi:hypothetical protein
MNKEEFDAIRDGDIFCHGEIENSPLGMFITGDRQKDLMRWIAKKGHGNDWAIYYHWSSRGWEYVESNGDKVINKEVIKRLVPCDDEVLNLYRY